MMVILESMLHGDDDHYSPDGAPVAQNQQPSPQQAASLPPTPSSAAWSVTTKRAQYSVWSIGELKKELEWHNISYEGCTEKQELVELLVHHRPSDNEDDDEDDDEVEDEAPSPAPIAPPPPVVAPAPRQPQQPPAMIGPYRVVPEDEASSADDGEMGEEGDDEDDGGASDVSDVYEVERIINSRVTAEGTRSTSLNGRAGAIGIMAGSRQRISWSADSSIAGSIHGTHGMWIAHGSRTLLLSSPLCARRMMC